MNRLELFRLLRRNVKLSEKRSPALEQSMVAKVMMYIGAALMGAYMIFLGSLLGKIQQFITLRFCHSFKILIKRKDTAHTRKRNFVTCKIVFRIASDHFQSSDCTRVYQLTGTFREIHALIYGNDYGIQFNP